MALASNAGARTGGGATGSFAVPEETLQKWDAYDGMTIEKLDVDGLVRTRPQTIMWLIYSKPGDPFNSLKLATDLQTLFNTGNLYDLKGEVMPSADGKGVDVRIMLLDKWTLFPVFGAQGGGGSFTLGGGVFESNLLGYMVNASALLWTFNNTTSYDLNTNQEYFHGSNIMWSLDVQDSIEPQNPRTSTNNTPGIFAWRRQQKEIMLGTHFEGPIRAFMYASIYQDSIFENDGNYFHPSTAPGLQQRVYPKLIYGRVNWSNFLENGYELTIQPTFANLLGSGPEYVALEADFKRVAIVGSKKRDNLAAYFSVSTMGNGGPNYQYQVGGYYNVRGYADMREFGRRMAFTNLEYRPFIGSYRWQLFGIDLMAVQGCVFTDAGSAWGDSSLTGEAQAMIFRPLWSAGVGLRVNMVKFAGTIMRLDWARTISPDEGIGFSFGVGQFF